MILLQTEDTSIWLIPLIIALIPLAIIIWALIDALKTSFGSDMEKVLWIAAILLIPVIGAITYLVVGKKQKA